MTLALDKEQLECLTANAIAVVGLGAAQGHLVLRNGKRWQELERLTGAIRAVLYTAAREATLCALR